jgi:hypothetical protein
LEKEALVSFVTFLLSEKTERKTKKNHEKPRETSVNETGIWLYKYGNILSEKLIPIYALTREVAIYVETSIIIQLVNGLDL